MKSRYQIWRAVPLVASALFAQVIALHAEELPTYGLVIENDVFARTDRDYTSGVKLYTVRRAGSGKELARKFLGAGDRDVARLSFALGQSDFTPDDYRLVTPPPDQHPYAGWLYGEGNLILVRQNGVIDTLGLQAGVVGPAALGEETQRFIHRTFNYTIPRGWSHQLRNEPGLALSFDRKWAPRKTHRGSTEFDVAPFAGLSLGNVLTEARGGLIFRMGSDLRGDLGPGRVGPGIPYAGADDRARHFAWTVFGSAAAHAKVRDIFLDGNTFVSSASVEKKNVVGEFQAGFTLKFGRVDLSYTHVWRTLQYKTEFDPHSFGALSLSAKF